MQRKVLIVDDETEVLEMMKRKLERSGYKAFTAANVQDGLNILAEEDVDLVMTDIIMTPMDGYALCRQLRSVARTEKLPVIVCSAHALPEDVFKESNVKEFLPKPFDGQTFLAAIEKVLQRAPRYKNVLIQANGGDELRPALAQLEEWKKAGVEFKIVSNAFDLVSEALGARPDLLVVDGANEEYPVDKLIKNLRGYVVLKDVAIFCYIDDRGRGLNRSAKEVQKIRDLCFEAGANGCLEEFNALSLLSIVFEC